MNCQVPNCRVSQIGANLREIRPLVRARMQIYEGITVALHYCKYRVRNHTSNTAAGPAWKSPIQIAPVGQVSITASNTFGVNGWQYDQRAVQVLWIDLSE
jgi:hypothetical protein